MVKRLRDLFRWDVFLKGMLMGSADIIPGVSGGTIALITGIYEQLIFSLSAVFSAENLRLLRQGRIDLIWKRINGPFLLSVMTGILASIFLLARLISWLFHHYPLLVWAFFFGLIAASGLFLLRKTGLTAGAMAGWVLLGAALALVITFIRPAPSTDDHLSWWALFGGGMAASIAMILPGISGSYILILLGMYRAVLEKVKQLDIIPLLVFTAGVVVGLGGFSKFLKWLFARYEKQTLAVLGGFLLGSLGMVWPWKNDYRPVWPRAYDGDPQYGWVIFWMLTGFAVVWLIEKAARRYGN